MATKGTIPAKRRAAAKPVKKVKRKQRPTAEKPARRADIASATSTTALPAQAVDLGTGAPRRVENMVHLAIDHAKACSTRYFGIPIGGGRYLVLGTAADLRLLADNLEPRPKRRLVRDSITGLFIRARDALRRPKTTTTEKR